MITGIALILIGCYIAMPKATMITLIVLGAVKCAVSLIDLGFKLKSGE